MDNDVVYTISGQESGHPGGVVGVDDAGRVIPHIALNPRAGKKYENHENLGMFLDAQYRNQACFWTRNTKTRGS